MPGKNVPKTRWLTKEEVPNGTTIALVNDVHFGCADIRAMDLIVNMVDDSDASIFIANGDIHDCGPVSPHLGKQRASAMKNGQLLEEAEEGVPYLKWMASSKFDLALYGEGNHEDWINDVARASNAVGSFTVGSALGVPGGIEMLPHEYQIRLGNLVAEHGDILLGKSMGGANLARTILTRYPDQTTIVGHFHRSDYAVRTSPDNRGNLRSRAAYAIGHVSDPNAHREYAGRAPSWQQGFAFIRVWYVDGKPRFTVEPVEIHRTRYGRPVAERNGKIYR